MYLPKQFNNTDPAVAQRIMREHPLAAIVSVGDDGFPVLSHIPLHWQAASLWGDEPASEHGVFLGHCARANPHAQWLALQPLPLGRTRAARLIAHAVADFANGGRKI